MGSKQSDVADIATGSGPGSGPDEDDLYSADLSKDELDKLCKARLEELRATELHKGSGATERPKPCV